MKVKIDLRKNVFEPRTETKYWAKKALKEIGERFDQNKELRILDLFAGSGFLGLSALKYFPQVVVHFADISSDAIEQIRINAQLNDIPETRYKILRSNIFSEIGERYDVILANPPYVALARINEVQPDVLKNEPAEALFSGKDGLDIIRKFLNKAGEYLNQEGLIFMEFDPLQKQSIEQILKNKNFAFDFRKDQFGQHRWLKCFN